MINLNANVTFPNINRWQVLAFDVNTGRVTLRFWAPANTSPSPPWIDKLCQLSDLAGQSSVASVNPAPQSWDDKIIVSGLGPAGGGGGAANALTNAQTAYRSTGGNHNAGMRAVEGVAMTDGWVSPALAGT